MSLVLPVLPAPRAPPALLVLLVPPEPKVRKDLKAILVSVPAGR